MLSRVIKGGSCCRALKKVRREAPEQGEEGEWQGEVSLLAKGTGSAKALRKVGWWW